MEGNLEGHVCLSMSPVQLLCQIIPFLHIILLIITFGTCKMYTSKGSNEDFDILMLNFIP